MFKKEVSILNPNIKVQNRFYLPSSNGINNFKEEIEIAKLKKTNETVCKRQDFQIEYTNLDQKYIQKQIKQSLNGINIPMEKDVKQSNIRNKIEIPMNQHNIEKIFNVKKETFVPSKNQINTKIEFNKENFNHNSLKDTDELYKEMFRSYAKCISFYLRNNSKYSYWNEYWKRLEENLNKNNLNLERLNEKNIDIAYTENKGEVMKFRWRDSKKYISKHVFVYVLLHELAHETFPSYFIGHKDPFPDMLCILTVAALELQLFDLSKIPNFMVTTNDQPITSKQTLKQELLRGIELLNEQNKDSSSYYSQLKHYVISK